MGKTREVRTFLLAPASASMVGSVRLRKFMDGCLACEMTAGGASALAACASESVVRPRCSRRSLLLLAAAGNARRPMIEAVA